MRQMEPRDGIAIWRVMRERRRVFCGPFSFMVLAQRYWRTSAVLERDDEVVGYLVARRDCEALRIVDCELSCDDAERSILWELLQTAVGSNRDVAYVELPCMVDDRLRRACVPAPLPALAKASPPTLMPRRLLGPHSNGAFTRALA